MSPAALGTAAGLVLVPGTGAMLAVYPPGRAGLATRIALAFALGYAAVGMSAAVLVIAHVLSHASFLIALAAVTLALWGMALRRGRPGEHLAALREEWAGDRVALAAGLVVLVAIAVVRLRSSPLLDFQMFGPWRYWADGLELADAGHVPGQSLQWGALYTPAISKLVLNSFHAGSSYLLGRSPLPAMGALLWVASTGLAAGLWALGRELGLRLLAPLLPLLTLTLLNDELRRNLDVYTAENVGRMVAVCGLLVGVRALRDRDGWLEPAVAALLFGTGFATHGVPVVALMIALGWYGVGRLIRECDRGPIVARMAAIALGAPAITVALLHSAGGTIGFQGASGSDRYASFGAGVDPTASLLSGTIEHSPTGHGHWYVGPSGIGTYFLRAVTTLDDPPRILLWLIPVAVLAGTIAIVRWLPVDLGAAAVMAAGLGVSLVGIAFLFSYRYRTQIPGRFGIDREFDYLPLAVVVLVLVALEPAAAWIGRRRAWAPAAVAAVVIALPAVAVGSTVGPARTSYRTNGERALTILDWVSAHVPCDARILPDRVTLGTFVAATGRVSVVEGMGPYLRPDMLHPVLDQVLAAHRFFQDPAHGFGFLQQQGVNYVIVVKGVRIGSMVGTLESGVDPAAFAGIRFLRPVLKSPDADVYRVRLPIRLGGFRDAGAHPGYRCMHGPVADGS
ncbi:MAG TPA: hypothetical protein VLB81_00430 [Gaiellales bacterium]|nr:hypothetical protein [Gaiellales bacterium]